MKSGQFKTWEIVGKVKWITTKCTKEGRDPKKLMLRIWLDWKEILFYELRPESQMIDLNKYFFQLVQVKVTIGKK